MKRIDRDGLLLCELQARLFEDSLKYEKSSSEVFIRRFMHSNVVKELDSTAILMTNLQPRDILKRLDEQYGVSEYGTVKYLADEMYWIGYIYRYYAYTYEKTSLQVYRTVKPKELRSLFLPYHTMDPAQAIDRILEAKGLVYDEAAELQRQFEIYKRIRQGGQAS
jgi:YesN/AraC family two-component response regulator